MTTYNPIGILPEEEKYRDLKYQAQQTLYPVKQTRLNSSHSLKEIARVLSPIWEVNFIVTYSFVHSKLELPETWASLPSLKDKRKKYTVSLLETRLSDYLAVIGYSNEQAREVFKQLTKIESSIRYVEPNKKLTSR
ncbi:hypothetical protein J4461_00135 [Candidatus Pacearchaeota archaeon]|nr:hypothetical protein [Candidatus Pacearchaeota archaeon]